MIDTKGYHDRIDIIPNIREDGSGPSDSLTYFCCEAAGFPRLDAAILYRYLGAFRKVLSSPRTRDISRKQEPYCTRAELALRVSQADCKIG